MPQNALKLLISLLALLHLARATEPKNTIDKWDVSIGAGVFYMPTYKGSDEMEARALPYFNVKYNNFFFSPMKGLGMYAYKGKNLRIRTAIGYVEERDESNDKSNLNGLGDIDATASAKLDFIYKLGPLKSYVGLSQHLGGTEGLEVEAGVKAMLPIAVLTGEKSFKELKQKRKNSTRGAGLMLRLYTQWLDDTYAQSYYGINPLQSQRSMLPQYSAKAGFHSINSQISMMNPITQNWSVMSSVKYTKLLGEVKDSPIVKDNNQFMTNLVLRYKF